MRSALRRRRRTTAIRSPGTTRAGALRAFGADDGSGNTNVPCTGSFGDVKGLDNWTYYPSTVASSSLDIVSSADVSIAKTHTGSFTVGTNGTFTLAVANAGPRCLGRSDRDRHPSGRPELRLGSGAGWTCGAAGAAVTCSNAAGLASGGSTTITLTVSVGAAAAPATTNTASVDRRQGRPEQRQQQLERPGERHPDPACGRRRRDDAAGHARHDRSDCERQPRRDTDGDHLAHDPRARVGDVRDVDLHVHARRRLRGRRFVRLHDHRFQRPHLDRNGDDHHHAAGARAGTNARAGTDSRSRCYGPGDHRARARLDCTRDGRRARCHRSQQRPRLSSRVDGDADGACGLHAAPGDDRDQRRRSRRHVHRHRGVVHLSARHARLRRHGADHLAGERGQAASPPVPTWSARTSARRLPTPSRRTTRPRG